MPRTARQRDYRVDYLDALDVIEHRERMMDLAAYALREILNT